MIEFFGQAVAIALALGLAMVAVGISSVAIAGLYGLALLVRGKAPRAAYASAERYWREHVHRLTNWRDWFWALILLLVALLLMDRL